MLNPLDDWTSGYTQPGPLKNALGSAPTGAQPHGGNSLEQAWAPMSANSGGTISPGPSAMKPPAGPTASNPADAITRSLGVAPTANWSLGDTPTAPATPDYTPHVAAVTSGQPHAPDTLARQLATDFTQAGHKVSWGSNGELVVDGRPYDVLGSTGYQAMTADPNAGAPPPFPGHGAPPPPTPPPPTTPPPTTPAPATPAPNEVPQLPPGSEVPGLPANGYRPINGWVDTKMNDATHTSPKYDFMRAVQQLGIPGGGLGSPGDRAVMAQRLPDVVAQLRASGHPNAKLVGDDSIDFADGYGPIDVLTGNGEWWWSGDQSAHPGGNAAPGGTGAGATSPGLAALWDQAGGLHDAAPYQPTTNPQLDAFITQLLGHPESMDPHTVETMKAADSEEQQQAADSADASLKRFGFGSGLGDSNWLASERAATARSADQGIITGRRNIDIKAAETNMADRRAAAGIGINKLQLDNTIKTQAAQLGLTREQLISAILQHIATLEQNDRQFGADLGYRYDALNSSNNNAYWNGTQ